MPEDNETTVWAGDDTTGSIKSNALKFVSETPDDLRVANHIVLFGGRDLEGIMSPSVNPDGSVGEYFTTDTDLESEGTKAGQLQVDWEHGQQPEAEGPGPRDVLGYVDWKTAKWTDLGVWVERVLDRRNKYVKYLEKLIKKGLIGNSSEADQDGIEREEDGKIAKWPLVRDTLTVSPMEPRMLTENVISALKALELTDLLPDAELKPSAGLDDEADDKEDEIISKNIKGKEPKTMTDEIVENEVVEEVEPTPAPVIDMDAITKQVTEAASKAATDAVKALWDEEASKEKPGGFATPNVMKNANLGDPDPVEDFYNWVRTGKGKIPEHTVIADMPDGMGGTYKAALQEGTTTEGGYLVPAGELGRIIEKRDEVALLPKVGASIFTTDRDVFNIPTEGTALTKYAIISEESAISGAEEEPTFGQVAVTIYNFKKLIKVSEELLEDYNSGLDAFLTSALGRAWGITENYYIQIGSGSSQPQGVFVGGTAALTLDSGSAIGAGEIPELMGKLEMAYRPGAVMIMARETIAYLRGLTSASVFTFAATPAKDITTGGEDLNIGYPVFGTEDAATITTSAKSLLFGNWALYGWVRNRSLRVRRLVELYAGNGQVGILANYRAGGGVLQAEAFQYATHPTA